MLSFYVHIPYCVRRCGYCDFNTYTPSELQDGATLEIVSGDYIDAVLKELEAAPKDVVPTIFFGGGTPSLLPPKDLGRVIAAIKARNGITDDCEITLEANPEDLNPTYLSDLKTLGINRLSIGIQSFQEENLSFLNRNHSSAQALTCISHAQDIGIDNISIDLIYGIPGNELKDLTSDINMAVDTKINHISAYSLTIEPKTVFGQQKKKGVFKELPESIQSQKFS